MNIQESTTQVIKRSQIKFADYNPRKESETVLKSIRNNFKRVGFLGGIVWNSTTGNLVSGHKRIQAMDQLNKYDATPETDYDVKVEMVQLDQQTEMEQNIYMNNQSVQGEYDFEKLAAILPNIETKNAGLTADDLDLISVYAPDVDLGNASDIINDLNEIGKPLKEFKEVEKQIRAAENSEEQPTEETNEQDPEKPEKPAFDYRKIKEQQKESAQNSVAEKYVTLSFTTYDAKYLFMTKLNFDPSLTIIKGEELERKLNL